LTPPVLETPDPEEFFRVIMMIRKKVNALLQLLQCDYFCIATSGNCI
jgi:hypothetical protein